MSDYDSSESSYNEDYYNMDSGYAMPSSEMDDGFEEEIHEYWQPIINMKLSDQGQVLLQGSSIQLFRYENDRLVCIQKYNDVLFISEDSPILEATNGGPFIYQKITSLSHKKIQKKKIQKKKIQKKQIFLVFLTVFHFNLVLVRFKWLSVWDNIQWDDLDTLQPNEIEYSVLLEINEVTLDTWNWSKDPKWLFSDHRIAFHCRN